MPGPRCARRECAEAECPLTALQGLHVKEIATRADVESKLLGQSPTLHSSQNIFSAHWVMLLKARILRLLATHHIFREISTDMFATNRISSTLDKGKPVDVLFEKYVSRCQLHATLLIY